MKCPFGLQFYQAQLVTYFQTLNYEQNHIYYDRVFMALVGPSGTGETHLILKMLQGHTFYPKVNSIYFFLQGISTTVWHGFQNTADTIYKIHFVRCYQ